MAYVPLDVSSGERLARKGCRPCAQAERLGLFSGWRSPRGGPRLARQPVPLRLAVAQSVSSERLLALPGRKVGQHPAGWALAGPSRRAGVRVGRSALGCRKAPKATTAADAGASPAGRYASAEPTSVDVPPLSGTQWRAPTEPRARSRVWWVQGAQGHALPCGRPPRRTHYARASASSCALGCGLGAQDAAC